VDRKRRRQDDLGVTADSDSAAVPVAVVGSRTEAELIVGMLRNNGLRAVVSADDAGGQEPALQTGVRVLTAPRDEVEARRLLAAADDAAASDR
jgi:hypothetical protein